MEPERIDTIVRSLATSGSRRKALGAAVAGLLGGTAADAAAADRKGDGKGDGKGKGNGKGRRKRGPGGAPEPQQATCAGRGQNCRKVPCCAGLDCRGGTCSGNLPVFSVTGPTGPTGPRGVTGPQGRQGTTGPTGLRGNIGTAAGSGPVGPAGDGVACVRIVGEEDLASPDEYGSFFNIAECDEGETAIACAYRVPPTGEVELLSLYRYDSYCLGAFQADPTNKREFPSLVYAYCASSDPDCAPVSNSVAIGQPCVPGVDTCADPDASCTFFYNSEDSSIPSELGTYCLYPAGHACSAASECTLGGCNGVCTTPCTVCASAADCKYTTIKAAVDAANLGQLGTNPTITVASGTYQETGITFTKGMTVKACDDNGPVVIDGNLSTTSIFKDRTCPGNTCRTTVQQVTIEGGATHRLHLKRTRTSGGGGVLQFGDSGNMVLRNVEFSDHQSTFGGAAIDKGGAFGLTLENCDVHDNTSAGAGGGISAATGQLTFVGYNRVRNNSGLLGGGVFADTNCTFTMDPTADQLITGNTATSKGGGLGVYLGTGWNCTNVVNNTSPSCANIVINYGLGPSETCTCP